MARTFEEIFNGLPTDEQKVLRSTIDSRITGAIKTHSINNPSPKEALERINKRIEQIEVAKLEKEKQFELKTHAIEKCYETGIPFSVVSDLLPNFKSAEELDKKIETLSKLSRSNDVAAMNEMLANNSYKPGGGSHAENDPLDKMRRTLPPGDLAEFDKNVERTRRR
jgi:hypothetical protein